MYNGEEECVRSRELAGLIRSFLSEDSPDIIISAAKAAVVDYMGTGSM